MFSAKHGIIVAFIFSLLLIGCVNNGSGQQQTPSTNQGYTSTTVSGVNALVNTTLNRVDAGGGLNNDLTEQRKAELARLVAIYDTPYNQTRPNYLPDVVYKDIPPFPSDFYKIRVLIQYGKIFDLTTLDEGYWRQPEFYPGFEQSGVNLMLNPPGDRWGAFGFGSYPGDSVVRVAAGQSVSLTTFFHSSWLVQTYQGMSLDVVYNNDSQVQYSDLTGATDIKQDAQRVKNYFDVSVTPNTFLLDPAYPYFGKNWAVKVITRITVKAGTPSGNYVIGINPVNPPSDMGDQWFHQYLNRYTSVGSFGIGRPFYQIVVVVP